MALPVMGVVKGPSSFITFSKARCPWAYKPGLPELKSSQSFIIIEVQRTSVNHSEGVELFAIMPQG